MVAPGDLINKVTQLPQIPTIESFVLPVLPEVGDLFNIIQGLIPGGLFQNPIQGPIVDCLAEIGVKRADHLLLPVLDQDPLLLAAWDDADSALGSFQTHSSNISSGLSQDMNPVIACLKVRQSVGGGLPIGNPCTALNDVYGSILGDGAALIAGLAAALIAGAVALIQAALGPILDMIAREVAALNAILTELTNFATASSLANLSLDPCAQALFNSAGTPGLFNALANMPKF